MNRILVALLAGAAIFGAVFALAAELPVSSSDLASGTDEIAACDDSVDVSYATTFDAGYMVTSITVDDIASACDGETLEVTITDDSTGVVFTGSVASISSPSESISVSPNVAVGLFDDIFVLINGVPTP